MEEFDYPGIRVMLEATLDRMRQPIKIDISTDDVITPKAIEYDYKLMFEDRTISVLTYNKVRGKPALDRASKEGV